MRLVKLNILHSTLFDLKKVFLGFSCFEFTIFAFARERANAKIYYINKALASWLSDRRPAGRHAAGPAVTARRCQPTAAASDRY